MKHPMMPHADANQPDYKAALETVQKFARDNPMPRELRMQIVQWIEPQTMRTETDHGDVMDAIAVAYPLIRDWHAEVARSGSGRDDTDGGDHG